MKKEIMLHNLSFIRTKKGEKFKRIATHILLQTYIQYLGIIIFSISFVNTWNGIQNPQNIVNATYIA